MLKLSRLLTLSLLVAASATVPAQADRKPTLEERSRIETKLKELGYTSWDEIEFDTNRNNWEIDDALAVDGRYYDLRLAPNTLDELSRRLDD